MRTRQRVIIAGGGRVGGRAATVLRDHGHDPVIVERDPDRSEQLANHSRSVVVTGDARRSAVLDQADPGRADAFAALTGDDATNRALCDRVAARTEGVRTVARVEDPTADAGAADRVVVPSAAGAKAAASAVTGGEWSLLDLPAAGVDLLEVGVDPRAPAARERLGSVSLPRGARVVADAGAGAVPGPSTELRPGRRYVVATEPAVADEVRTLLRG